MINYEGGGNWVAGGCLTNQLSPLLSEVSASPRLHSVTSEQDDKCQRAMRKKVFNRGTPSWHGINCLEKVSHELMQIGTGKTSKESKTQGQK